VVAITRLCEQVAEVFDRAQQLTETGRPLTDMLPEPTDDDAAPEPPMAASAPDERMLVRATLDFLADPAVAQAVLVETIGAGRDGAAALGLFAESLEQQAPRSAHPALRWLRGKALERLGNIGETEPAFEVALTLDATWTPALFELARYASGRGYAQRGLSLLRRAGAPADDELVVLLQRFCRSSGRTSAATRHVGAARDASTRCATAAGSSCRWRNGPRGCIRGRARTWRTGRGAARSWMLRGSGPATGTGRWSLRGHPGPARMRCGAVRGRRFRRVSRQARPAAAR
jgi:hypothetical protein